MEGKRKVILGFEEPSEMEGDAIYVTFHYNGAVYVRGGGQDYFVRADIASLEEFKHHPDSGRTEASANCSKCSCSDDSINGFIDDIVQSNEGQVDNLKLFEQHDDARSKVERMIELCGGGAPEGLAGSGGVADYPKLIKEGCSYYFTIEELKGILMAKGLAI